MDGFAAALATVYLDGPRRSKAVDDTNALAFFRDQPGPLRAVPRRARHNGVQRRECRKRAERAPAPPPAPSRSRAANTALSDSSRRSGVDGSIDNTYLEALAHQNLLGLPSYVQPGGGLAELGPQVRHLTRRTKKTGRGEKIKKHDGFNRLMNGVYDA